MNTCRLMDLTTSQCRWSMSYCLNQGRLIKLIREPPALMISRRRKVSKTYYDVSLMNASATEVPTNEEREQIAQQLAHKWRLVGLQLGVDPAKLDQIASECDGDQSCCSVLLRKLSTGEVTASCPFTWRGVIETLDSNN